MNSQLLSRLRGLLATKLIISSASRGICCRSLSAEWRDHTAYHLERILHRDLGFDVAVGRRPPQLETRKSGCQTTMETNV